MHTLTNMLYNKTLFFPHRAFACKDFWLHIWTIPEMQQNQQVRTQGMAEVTDMSRWYKLHNLT